MRTMLKGKIHRARVTDANVNYEGSITIDRKLMEAADILPYEQVDVVNVNNGSRLTTYAIEGEPGSGTIGLNGAAARKGLCGDMIIIVSFAYFTEDGLKDYHPKIVLLNESNRIKKWLHK